MSRYGHRKLTKKWTEIIKQDPCTYCGEPSTSADHIVPRLYKVLRGMGSTILASTGFSRDHWTNLTPACCRCNQERGCIGLLKFLWLRHSCSFYHRRTT